MNRDTYLQELRLQLQAEDFAQVEEAVAYFNELLEDKIAEEGMDEELAVAQLENPQAVARQILESQQKSQQHQTQEPQREKNTEEQQPWSPGVRTINAKASLVRQIVVTDRNMRLMVFGEDREDIEIKHPETERIKYNFTLQDGKLSLERIIENSGFGFFANFQFFGIEKPTMNQVTIKVPRELAAEMDLRTSNAKLTLENINCWGNLNAKSSNANISLEKFAAKSMALKTSNATIILHDVESKQGLTANTSNGSIKANAVTAPLELWLQTSNGSILVEKLVSKSFTFHTSNGSIRGSLPGNPGDYSITSTTSNGKNSLSNLGGNGPKTLRARTSNGTISLQFEESGNAFGNASANATSSQFDSQPLDEAIEQKITSALDGLEQQMDDLGDRISQGVESRINQLMQRLENLKNTSPDSDETQG